MSTIMGRVRAGWAIGAVIVLAPLVAPAALVAGPSCGQCDRNLVVNGDAEFDTGGVEDEVVSPSGWSTNGNFRAEQYGQDDFPDASNSSGDPGSNLFAGGPDDDYSTAVQNVPLTETARIDAGALEFDFAAWLGGWQAQGDAMTITAEFLDASGSPLDTVQLGPVTAADREGATKLLLRVATGEVPVGAREVTILMEATRDAGHANDGYADDVELILTDTGTSAPGGPTPLPPAPPPAVSYPSDLHYLPGDYTTPDGVRVRVTNMGSNVLVGEVVDAGPLGSCVGAGEQIWIMDRTDEIDLLGTVVAIDPTSCERTEYDATFEDISEAVQICIGDECTVSDAVAPGLDWINGADPRDVAVSLGLTHARLLGWAVDPQRQSGERVLYVATNANFADALSVAGITGANGGLFLEIDPADGDGNRADIARLRPDRLVVVGGQAALPDSVLPPESEMPRERIGGLTRFETAVLLSQSTYDHADTVFIATGSDFPDAIAGGAQASLRRAPILLVHDQVPSDTAAELQRLSPSQIRVLGGSAAVPDAVVNELRQHAPTARLAGGSRIETAVAVSQAGYGGQTDVAYLANARDYRNGLMVAGNAWVLGGPLLLTEPTRLSVATTTELARLDPAHVMLVSDRFELDSQVLTDIEDFAATLE